MSLEKFDADIKELTGSGKLSASKIKAVTDLALANISHDAHIVATLFKAHKQAKAAHKLSSLYVIDAICREARQTVKKGRDKPANNANEDDQDDNRKILKKGNCASFLLKIESFLDRLVAEVVNKGPPEHKEKVKKVLDIWSKTSTFSAEALKSAYGKLTGEIDASSSKTAKTLDAPRPSSSSTTPIPVRSTTPPYPPPDRVIRFPPIPPLPPQFGYQQQPYQANNVPFAGPSHQQGNGPALPQDQLASLLALTGAGAGQSQPAYAQQAQQHQPPQPTFEGSQLALLQQLASQTGQTAPASAPGPSGLAPDALSSLAQAFGAQQPPAASTSSVPFPYPGPHGGQRGNGDPRRGNDRFDGRNERRRSHSPPPRQASGPNWQPPFDNGVNSYPADSRNNRDERVGRRSRSPPLRNGPGNDFGNQRQPIPAQVQRPPQSAPSVDPAASLAAWKERNLGGPGGNRGPGGGEGQPGQFGGQRQQQQEGRISSFISNDNFDESDNRKGKRPAGRGFESADLSSFEVATNDAAAGSDKQSLSMGQDQNDGSSGSMPQFNPMTFNALDPQSWAGFAMMWQSMFGTMPTNTQLVQWIMMRMQMMGAGPQGSAMMGGMPGSMMMQQSGGMMGMQQQQQQQDNGQQVQESRSERPPIPTRPPGDKAGRHDRAEHEGEGEADMDVNTDDEK